MFWIKAPSVLDGTIIRYPFVLHIPNIIFISFDLLIVIFVK